MRKLGRVAFGLGVVALLVTACGGGSGTQAVNFGDTVVATEHAFPNISGWKTSRDITSGTDSDPPRLARVILDGRPSKVTGVQALVTLSRDWSGDGIVRSVGYLIAAGGLGAGEQGRLWVSQQLGRVAGGQKTNAVRASRLFGAVWLSFMSEDEVGQPPIVAVFVTPKMEVNPLSR
jgi:hypothetical protein